MGERDPESDAVFRDIVASYGGAPAVGTKRMFGATALMVDGKMAAFVTNEGELVAKLPAAAIARLADAGHGAPMVMNGRAMREWFAVPRSPEVDWFALADEAVTYVRSLEPANVAAEAGQEP